MKFEFSASELNAMTVEQRKELLSGEFSRWKMVQAAKHIAPFWWVEPRQSPFLITPPAPRVRNGTAFFIEIEGQLLCITAAHVYRGYLDSIRHYPGLWCRLGEGEFIFDAVANLRSIGGQTSGIDNVDIAIFNISADALRTIGKEAVVVAAGSWPPLHPFSGQEGTLIGYPNSSKLWTSAREISFGIYCASSPIGSASDRQITVPFERDYWHDTLGRGLPPEGMNLGGLSGGPLLILTEQNRDWKYHVGGVISEMPSSSHFEMVAVEPAHFIAADGTVLDERSVPMRRYVRAEE